MKKSAIHAFLAAAALLFCACSSDLTENGNENETAKASISATQELLTEDGKAFAPSRTVLAPDNNNTTEWTKGDAIGIFDGKSHCKYTAANSGTTCTFVSSNTKADENAAHFIAVYPYNMANTISGNTVSKVTLPSNQVATENGFDPACNLMAASSTALNTTLQFKHVCSYIKVQPGFDCSRIVLTFNTGAQVAGTFDMTVGSDGVPTVSNVTEASNTITLLGDIKGGKNYYIAVLPNSYKGFTVSLEAKLTKDMVNWDNMTVNTSSYKKSTEKTLTADRATIKNLGILDTKTTTQDAKFTVEFEDLGLGSDRNAEHGTKILWAKVNLGANSETEAGGYYAWGETKTKDNYSQNTYLCEDYYPSVLDISHDAAAVNFGHGWRTPSEEDFVNLKENTIFVYTRNYNGATGFLVYPAGKTAGGKDVRNYQKMADGTVYRYETEFEPTGKTISDPDILNYIAELSPEKSKHLFIVFGGTMAGSVVSGTDAARYWLNSHGDQYLPSTKVPNESTAYYFGLSDIKFNSLSRYCPRYEGLNIRPCITFTW